MKIIALLFAFLPSLAMATDTCSWNKPGADRYIGVVPDAVEHYTDIPPLIRAKLKARMERRQYDEVVAIRGDAIEGESQYSPEITDMHFGANKMCKKVDRTKWHPMAIELGLVYCEQEHCILVPTICGNVARINRLRMPLLFEAPGAGLKDGPAIPDDDVPLYGPDHRTYYPQGQQDRIGGPGTEVYSVPEPGSIALALIALCAMAGLRIRRRG